MLRDGTPISETLFTWAAMPGFNVDAAFYFDEITAVMCLIVTGIGTLIHIYSIGYMAHDAGFARYFAYLNLFLFFMLMLVLGKNLVVVFVGWEGVGLASYLLIGFWFNDPAKTAAGVKAFVVNRVGDTGFVLAAFLLFGLVGSFDFQVINTYFSSAAVAPGLATAIGLLLLLGVCGKSAQIPLHVWLPDAMAGPTPVSALIHAATMVTAGVYLIARMQGFYVHAPVAMNVIAWIGAATALLGATVAVTQFNLKKVLAYSTISQLGLMVLACGVGAFSVGLFHLLTHAFFKACLFLGAGAVLHALNGEEDMRNMGALARRLPFTFVTFLVGSAGALRDSALLRLLLQGRNPVQRLDRGQRIGVALGGGQRRVGADGVLHVPRDLHDVLRQRQRGADSEIPHPRTTALDVERAGRTGGGLTRRGLHRAAGCVAGLPGIHRAVLRFRGAGHERR